jgi:hypothetical protein
MLEFDIEFNDNITEEQAKVIVKNKEEILFKKKIDKIITGVQKLMLTKQNISQQIMKILKARKQILLYFLILLKN